MVLNAYGIKVEEKELYGKVIKAYGKSFKNIWNPTIAKLACEYGINTSMYALWPLFKKELLKRASSDFEKNPNNFNSNKYENKNDEEKLPEPLKLAYQEMFRAIKKGCKVYYGDLTSDRIKKFLKEDYLIQTSVKLNTLYQGKKKAYHSILLYGLTDNLILFHDPYYGKEKTVEVTQLQKSISDTGAYIIYKNLK